MGKGKSMFFQVTSIQIILFTQNILIQTSAFIMPYEMRSVIFTYYKRHHTINSHF